MKGHQPIIPVNTDAPIITPLMTAKDAATLVEQLNGLIVNYDKIYTAYKHSLFIKSEQIVESLTSVLKSIEKAIDAICERLTHNEYIAKFQ